MPPNLRVLKVHREAVRWAFRTYGHLVRDDMDEFVDRVAEAVVTAEDHTRTRYVVMLREDATGSLYCYGPYDTPNTAAAAVETVGLGGRAQIFPLSPHPAGLKISTRKKAG